MEMEGESAAGDGAAACVDKDVEPAYQEEYGGGKVNS